MNYYIFGRWVQDKADELVTQFGVPRDEAEELMRQVEFGSIQAEAKARSEHQFLLSFERLGSVELAKQMNMTPQGVCKRRTKILSNLNPELNARLNAA